MSSHRAMLTTVGARVRARRQAMALSRRALSERCGVSERYLAQLEAGHGNISLSRFADVAEALGTSPAELLAGTSPAPHGSQVVALLGVRGAGKSTVGTTLAERLGCPLVELDQEIEKEAGIDLAQIFELHGEAYFRRLEHQVLASLLATGRPCVLATGGSIVGAPDAFALLSERARTIWLKARAEDHWNRVIAQGDRRPMGENPHAFAELRTLLEERAPLYARADIIVDTTGLTIDEVTEAALTALRMPR